MVEQGNRVRSTTTGRDDEIDRLDRLPALRALYEATWRQAAVRNRADLAEGQGEDQRQRGRDAGNVSITQVRCHSRAPRAQRPNAGARHDATTGGSGRDRVGRPEWCRGSAYGGKMEAPTMAMRAAGHLNAPRRSRMARGRAPSSAAIVVIMIGRKKRGGMPRR